MRFEVARLEFYVAAVFKGEILFRTFCQGGEGFLTNIHFHKIKRTIQTKTARNTATTKQRTIEKHRTKERKRAREKYRKKITAKEREKERKRDRYKESKCERETEGKSYI